MRNSGSIGVPRMSQRRWKRHRVPGDPRAGRTHGYHPEAGRVSRWGVPWWTGRPSTCSSRGAWFRRSARASPPPRSARCSKARGLKVGVQKLDPYINVDPGTMSPYQHGEVYVTDDGAETDLDLGHYERFTYGHLDAEEQLITTGQVYQSVITKERRGRLPRRDGAGHSAHHRRDQGAHHAGRAAATWTWSSPRSAARSATSRACRSWKRSGSSIHVGQRERPLHPPHPRAA